MRYRAPKAKFKSDAMQVDAAREGQGHRGSTPLTSTISKPGFVREAGLLMGAFSLPAKNVEPSNAGTDS